MRIKFTPLLIATLLLSMIPVSANPIAASRDNTFTFSGPFGLVNPCNGELATGNIDIRIVVTTAVTGNGDVKVNVHHTSHGVLFGNLGNEYQVSRHAKGQFDAVSDSYVIPWTGQFIGKGDAPNFSADATLRVSVNADNEPVGSQGLTPVSRTCND